MGASLGAYWQAVASGAGMKATLYRWISEVVPTHPLKTLLAVLKDRWDAAFCGAGKSRTRVRFFPAKHTAANHRPIAGKPAPTPPSTLWEGRPRPKCVQSRRAGIRGEGAGAWLLSLQRLYNHGLPLAGAPKTSFPLGACPRFHAAPVGRACP